MEAHENYQKNGEAFETLVKRNGILLKVAKVMTEDQMETLRKQIAAYTVISEQLQKTYDVLSAQYLIDTSSFCNSNGDHHLRSTGIKMFRRHRWTPSPAQLEILELEFQDCNGNPGKQKMKDIALDLSQYGEVSENSVYNWFQNRRARCKRMTSGEAVTRRKKKARGLAVKSEAGNHCLEIGNEMLPSDCFGLVSSGSFGCSGLGWGDNNEFGGGNIFG